VFCLINLTDDRREEEERTGAAKVNDDAKARLRTDKELDLLLVICQKQPVEVDETKVIDGDEGDEGKESPCPSPFPGRALCLVQRGQRTLVSRDHRSQASCWPRSTRSQERKEGMKRIKRE